MTPLSLLAETRLANRGATCHLAARPAGVLHAYVGPLTPSGRFVPRAARPACGACTRALRVVPLSEVRRRRVCLRCTARLSRGPHATGGAGTQTRAALLAAYADVTPFDLAVDAWRAETRSDVDRVEWLALLLVGLKATKTDPVVSPLDGKTTGPLDQHLAKARRRLHIVRDPNSATARENELIGRDAVKARRRQGWRDREDQIERLGFINATARGRTA